MAEDGLTLELKRVLQAPPERVWKACTEPEELAKTVATLSLRDLGDSTELALSQGPFATKERHALHEGGWTDGFDRLEEAL